MSNKPLFGQTRRTIALLLLLFLAVTGCAQQRPSARITLSDLQPLDRDYREETLPLQVAIATGLSPTESIAGYQSITDYLSRRLGRPVKLNLRKTYQEVDDLIREGKVDIAFVCSSSYVIGRDTFGERLVAVPVANGSTTYQSAIIVNARTGINSWPQLKGRSLAIVDPQSTSGFLYALSKAVPYGGLSFFGSYIYTYSHNYSIEAVRNQVVDAAAVDSNVLARSIAKDPDLANAVKILDLSPNYGNNPVVAGQRLDDKTFLAIRQILLGMDKDPEGRQALQKARLDRFVLLPDNIYNSVRELMAEVRRDSR